MLTPSFNRWEDAGSGQGHVAQALEPGRAQDPAQSSRAGPSPPAAPLLYSRARLERALMVGRVAGRWWMCCHSALDSSILGVF